MAKLKATLVVILVVLLLGIGAVGASYKQVPEGHVGVEKDWGAVNGNTLNSGANWIIPVQQSVQTVETRPRTYTMTADENEGARSDADAVTVKTANGSSVGVSITIRYTIDKEQADKFVSEWNTEEQVESRLLRKTIETNLQDEGSSLTTTGSGAIYTSEGREALKQTTEKALEDEVSQEPISIERVQIRDIDLPQEIDNTLDQKEQAKQLVEVKKEEVKQAQAEKERKVVEAEAEARQIEIEGQALRENPIVLEQQRIEALENGNTIYVPTESGGVTLTKETANATASAQP
jgi:Membrane protease subunits, stomatin/prohibitin homologs